MNVDVSCLVLYFFIGWFGLELCAYDARREEYGRSRVPVVAYVLLGLFGGAFGELIGFWQYGLWAKMPTWLEVLIVIMTIVQLFFLWLIAFVQ